MISFSIDKQRGQVNVEWMSRPVDSLKKSNKQSTARLGLDIHGAVTYFCFSTEKKLLRGLIFRGAYNMKTYKNKKDGFKEIQKGTLRLTLPIFGLAMMFGLGIGYNNSDSGQISTLPFVILIGLAAGGFGIYKGLNRQRLLFDSYMLTVDGELLQREQLNTPIVKITKSEIKDIKKNKHGQITIRGRNKTDLIIVANQIEKYDELENELKLFGEIKLSPHQSPIDKFKIPILLAGLISMAIVYISTNEYLVLACGTILTLGLVWSLYVVQTNKNIDNKTKRSSLWTIVVILTVVAIMYSKLVK